METLAERWQEIQARIRVAAQKSGRTGHDVALVAASKTHPPETIREAVEAGQELFGESRVQEARAKIAEAPGRAHWHFIGHLQKNKIRHALPLFELFHSLDSLALAQDFQRIAEEEGARPRVLLEVNLAGEASKFGFRPAALREQIEAVAALPRLTLEGLMTIPPPAPDPESGRARFAELRELRDELERAGGLRLPHLSMGMSADYRVAVEEGATLVRVGSALFGRRSGKTWRPSAEE